VENIEATPTNIPPPATVAELIVTPDNPPWNGWIALATWLLSVIFIVFVPAVFVFPYLLAKGIKPSDPTLKEILFSDPTAVILQLAPVILAHILTLIACWFVVTRFNRYSFRQTLGWQLGGFKIWHAVLLTFVFYGFGYLMTLAFGHVDNDFERLIKGSRVAVYLVAALATFTAPLVEEVVYRGVLYSAFQQKFGFTIAVVIVTLLFTIVHVPQYSLNNVPDYASIITLLFLSLALTLVRATTGNLLPCIILHTIFNGLQSIFLVLEPWLESSSPQPTPDPTGFVFHIFK